MAAVRLAANRWRADHPDGGSKPHGKSMERDYYGLPVSTLAEDRDVVLREAAIAKNDPAIDVGGRDLNVKFNYDSPYWLAVVFQGREPKALVYCVMNQGGLIEGLRRDDPAVIQRVFDIRVTA
jgi:hypothetical protein